MLRVRGRSRQRARLLDVAALQLQQHVFHSQHPRVVENGYAGIVGEISLCNRHEDLWKFIDVFFKLSEEFDDFIFALETEDVADNVFYLEAARNEVLPKWASEPRLFSQRMFGFRGLLHGLSPDFCREKGIKDTSDALMDGIEAYPREARQVLVTEAVRQKLLECGSFGMRRLAVTLPERLACVARDRPRLLSHALRQFEQQLEQPHSATFSNQRLVRVTVSLGDADWKVATAVADIEAPSDIVSHRVRKAMELMAAHCGEDDSVRLDWDEATKKAAHAAINGHNDVCAEWREALAALSQQQLDQVRSIFQEGYRSTSDEDICSSESSITRVDEGRRKVIHKKKDMPRQLGKKAKLVAPLKRPEVLVPSEDVLELQSPRMLNLNNFERLLNGDHDFHASSEESLGEDELTGWQPGEARDRDDLLGVVTSPPPLAAIDEDDL